MLTLGTPSIFAFYTLAIFAVFGVSGIFSTLGASNALATDVSADVDVSASIHSTIAMTIASNGDTMTDCGIVNRYADSVGGTAGVVDGFDGTTGGANEVNDNTSCATGGSILPGAYTTASSTATVYTNSDGGYRLTVRALEDADLVDSLTSSTIPAGVISSETGGQSLWSYKTTDGTITNWTAMTTTNTLINQRAIPTSSGEETHIVYAISPDNSQTAGLYKVSLNYTATALDFGTITLYTLNYNAGDAGSSISTLNPTQSATTDTDTNTFTIPDTVPTWTGHDFLGWSDGETTYQPGDTITLSKNGNNMKTLTASWGLTNYTVTISNSNTTSGANSIQVPYGGSTTVTVTPSSNYYLSGVSCPEGYTCTDTNDNALDTTTSATGTQTVKVANNNTTAGGTLAFTGTLSGYTYSVSYNCNGGSGCPANYSEVDPANSKSYTIPNTTPTRTNYTFLGYTNTNTTSITHNKNSTITLTSSSPSMTLTARWRYSGSVSTKTLADGKTYTSTSIGSMNWYDAMFACPSGYHLPTQDEFSTLVGKYSGGGLNNATGWAGTYWSATSYNSSLARFLYVEGSLANKGGTKPKTDSTNVVCMAG